MQHTADDDMPDEIDFSAGKRGQFFQADAQLNVPVYLEHSTQSYLGKLATAKGLAYGELVNALLKKDIELIETAKV